ncbi:MAG: glycosyltransferase, partial [Burkholderiales bacterium]
VQNQFTNLVEKFIVVNNNSSDSTQQVIDAYNDKLTAIWEPKQGVSYARLAGAKLVTTSWMIYIDDDNFLESNWLVEANKYITNNPTVGAFNGAVIPLIEEPITEEEHEHLEIVYRRLACSHLRKEDIAPVVNHIPICAGLVIKTEPIKQLISQGWTKRVGRTGAGLSSGEDIEMTLYVKSKGYAFGFCETMVINHLLSKRRLSEQYLIERYKHNDIELELRSARFGLLAPAYLIAESLFYLLWYKVAQLAPISRKRLFDLKLRMAQGVAYLTGLVQGKRLPGTVRALGQHNSIGYRNHS